MIRWLYYWDEWRKVYWGSIDKHPELFAFLHRMVVFQNQHEFGQLKKETALSPKGIGNLSAKLWERFKNKCTKHNRAESSIKHSAESAASESLAQVDVLFYTHSNRDTCLGVGEKCFQKIKDQQLDITGAYYQNDRHRILFSERHCGVPVITLGTKISVRGLFRFIQLFPAVYLLGLRSGTVAKFIFAHPFITTVNLLKITISTAGIERLLADISPKLILACNEQGGDDNSILFALAKKRGIRTIQYLHCPPTRQFVPFICDEYWSWSELTTRMLLGEGKDSRVINMGSLEHENWGEGLAVSQVAPPPEKRVLFLAQMGMDEAWGIRAVEEGMKRFVDGLRLYTGELKVRVREHPYAGAKERSMLKAALKDVTYEITTKATPLAQDIEWATHVYSVSSTAILAALLAGKPAYLFWNKDMNEIHGRAFLPGKNIVCNSNEFIETLGRYVMADDAEATLCQVLGSPGAMDRAVERIKQLIALC
jgi:hypothetical protein